MFQQLGCGRRITCSHPPKLKTSHQYPVTLLGSSVFSYFYSTLYGDTIRQQKKNCGGGDRILLLFWHRRGGVLQLDRFESACSWILHLFTWIVIEIAALSLCKWVGSFSVAHCNAFICWIWALFMFCFFVNYDEKRRGQHWELSYQLQLKRRVKPSPLLAQASAFAGVGLEFL